MGPLQQQQQQQHGCPRYVKTHQNNAAASTAEGKAEHGGTLRAPALRPGTTKHGGPRSGDLSGTAEVPGRGAATPGVQADRGDSLPNSKSRRESTEYDLMDYSHDLLTQGMSQCEC